uniref:Helicase ATP-binding domain-containing protein n=1 Tax=Caenorhabditis tropicalis TaxID=1561998 RepID=A0A1I7T0U4_9PELO
MMQMDDHLESYQDGNGVHFWKNEKKMIVCCTVHPPWPYSRDLKEQESALRSSPDVVVATPGRLIDILHNSPSFNLASIEV